MKRIFLSTLVGAVIGAVVAIVLAILGYCIEIVSCFCDVGAYLSCDHKDVFNWEAYGVLFLICVISGAVIGTIYGIYKAKEEAAMVAEQERAEKLEKERKYRVQRAGELKKKALDVFEACGEPNNNIEHLISATYKAEDELEIIMTELLKISETKGKIDAMVEKMKENRIER